MAKAVSLLNLDELIHAVGARTQSEFAEIVGFTERTVSRWKGTKGIDTSTAVCLAKKTGIDVLVRDVEGNVYVFRPISANPTESPQPESLPSCGD